MTDSDRSAARLSSQDEPAIRTPSGPGPAGRAGGEAPVALAEKRTSPESQQSHELPWVPMGGSSPLDLGIATA